MRAFLTRSIVSVALLCGGLDLLAQRPASNIRLAALKKDVVAEVEARRELAQQMVDTIFSFSEVGFQEFETQRYVTGILEKEGFVVQRGVADITTAWVARWGATRWRAALR